jgi:hypothetical protein
MGRPDQPPAPPLNLVGDYGGGAMMLLVGVLAALHERHHSGFGQVIDAAMTDGATALMLVWNRRDPCHPSVGATLDARGGTFQACCAAVAQIAPVSSKIVATHAANPFAAGGEVAWIRRQPVRCRNGVH